VNGIEGGEYLGPMKRNTSFGYPENINPERELSGKNDYLIYDEETGITTLRPDIEARVLAMEQKAYLDEESEPVWLCANLKDERVPLRKIYDLKKMAEHPDEIWWSADTREMYTVPGVPSIHHRRFFGAYMENKMIGHLENGSQIGINPHSFEWGFLAHKISKFGKRTSKIGGDVEKMDASTPAICGWLTLQR